MAFTSELGSSKSLLGSMPLGASTDPFEANAYSGLIITQLAGSGISEGSTSSAISLTSEVSAIAETSQVASSSVVLTDAAVESGIHEETVTSALTLTSVGEFLPPIETDDTSTITVTQTAVSFAAKTYTASNALALTDAAVGVGSRVNAESILSLTSTAHKAEEYIKSAANILVLTSTAIGVGERQDAESTIALTSTADADGEKFRDAADTISLSQAVVETVSINVESVLTLSQSATQSRTLAEITSTLAITQTARALVQPSKATSTLTLSQEAISSIKNVSATSELELTSTFQTAVPVRVSATSEIVAYTEVFDPETFEITLQASGLSQSVDLEANVTNPASSLLSFASVATGYNVPGDAIEGLAESTLSLTDSAQTVFGEDVEQTLSLSDTATGEVAKTIPDGELSLSDEAIANIEYANLPATDSLLLKQAVAFTLEASTTLCDYSPFIGASTDPNAPTPPPATYAAANPVAYRLRWTDGMTADELALPKPSLGNRHRVTGQRVNTETRGGHLVIYADPNAPTVKTLLLTFTRLTAAQAGALQTFMYDYLGQEITYVDHEDRHWTGIITNVQDPIVEDRRGSFTASFEFQGSLA